MYFIFTTYTARHSYASVLKRSGANIAYISESLGHSDLKTTENYLASFEKEERIKNAALLTQGFFKHMMTRFTKQTGISLVICHYPPYSSKWNPIDHRLFCHLHKAANGVVFDCYQTVLDTFSKAQTSTGLTVVIRLNLKYYQTGQKINKKNIEYQKINPHPKIPELNYRISA